jgi:hypothetical protein
MSLDAPNPVTTDPKKFMTDFVEKLRFRSGDWTLADIKVAFLCLDQLIVDPLYRGSASAATRILASRFPDTARSFRSLTKKATECYPVRESVPCLPDCIMYLDALWTRWMMIGDGHAIDELIKIAEKTRHGELAEFIIKCIQKVSSRDAMLGKYLSNKYRAQAMNAGPNSYMKLG